MVKHRLPWWLSGKESTCQCRRHGFDPSSRKMTRGGATNCFLMVKHCKNMIYSLCVEYFYRIYLVKCNKAIEMSMKWQHTPVFLPGKSHGQRSLVGYSPWGHKESDTTEHTRTQPLKYYTEEKY
ncbi:hypothetical protein FD755_001164 [Muntiacus reevesi]|uniref:Uncharacterized protein n=1 Tax=Muntiacus reevesi TaxID=9886 RepID=A0A5J5N0F5_MUNRE|nr:hypothetical protein FD755_001164 [Muntiacus reevesi]